MDARIGHILARLRRGLEASYGPRLKHLVLFGSQARGDAVPGSDIDVLVVLSDPVVPHEEVHRTSRLVADLSLEFDVVVSCVLVGEESFVHRGGPLLRNVRSEGVPV